MAKKTSEDTKEKDQKRQEQIRRFAESISVRDVPQQEMQSPYPRIRTEKKRISVRS